MLSSHFNNCIKRIADGDGSAMSDIYFEYHERVRLTAKQIVKDDHEAQDIASNLMTYIFANAKRIPYVEFPNAWIHSLAKRRAIDFVRKDARCKKVDNFDEEMCEINGLNSLMETNASLDFLTNWERELVTCHYIWGYNYKEISRVHNKGESLIKKQIRIIKQKFIDLSDYL